MQLYISHLNTHENARLSLTHPWHSQKHTPPFPQQQFPMIPSYTAVHCVRHRDPCHTHPLHALDHTCTSTLAPDTQPTRGFSSPQSPLPAPHLPHHAHAPSLKGYGHSVILLAYFRITLSSLKMKRDLLTVKQFCLTGMGL